MTLNLTQYLDIDQIRSKIKIEVQTNPDKLRLKKIIFGKGELRLSGP